MLIMVCVCVFGMERSKARVTYTTTGTVRTVLASKGMCKYTLEQP